MPCLISFIWGQSSCKEREEKAKLTKQKSCHSGTRTHILEIGGNDKTNNLRLLKKTASYPKTLQYEIYAKSIGAKIGQFNVLIQIQRSLA